MFNYCKYLYDIEELKYLDVSNGNNFSEMFYNCNQLQNIDGLSNWNVSNGNNFSCMFSNCNQLQNIDIFKKSTFYKTCKYKDQLDLNFIFIN